MYVLVSMSIGIKQCTYKKGMVNVYFCKYNGKHRQAKKKNMTKIFRYSLLKIQIKEKLKTMVVLLFLLFEEIYKKEKSRRLLYAINRIPK